MAVQSRLALESEITRERVACDFDSIFPASAALRFYRAPGRINLIGEHTDYTLGLVCPIALSLRCYAAAAPNREGFLRVYSANRGELREWSIAEVEHARPAGDWTDYIIGVAQQLSRLKRKIPPLDLYIASDVPIGAGLSSSAALEICTALALLGEEEIGPLELAQLARRAENEFAGMPCGIMDQYVSVFGRERAALQIDCRSLTHACAPLPESVAILAVNSGVKHELGQSAYRERVRECAAALAGIQLRHPQVHSLRDAVPGMAAELACAEPGAVFRRARHVTSENQRVSQFMEACSANDLARMGNLFVESHASLRDDYQVSCGQLDFLVEVALALPGVYGARMTGGGFGGCTVNLVDPAHAEEFCERISTAFETRYGSAPETYSCSASAGAGQF